MKILHVTDYSMIGGIETYIKNISIEQSKKNLVTVIALEERNDFLKNKLYNYLDLTNKNFIMKLFFLRKKIIFENYDVIFVHSLKSKILFTILKKINKKINLIYIEHGVYFERRKHLAKIKRIIFNAIYKEATKIICVQETVKKSLVDNFKKLMNKTYIVENGINLEKFKYSYNYKDQKEINFITTARLVEEKEIHTLIDAFFLLKKEIKEKAKLLIIGEGPCLKSLKDKVKKYSLDNKIIFLGRKFNVEEYLSKSDIYIQPSKVEGFGLALLEAMAIGLPVIVSNIEAFRKLISLKNYIGFFEVSNSKELSKKMEILVEKDKKEIQKLSKEIRILAENYSIENTVKKINLIVLDNDKNEIK